MNSHFDLSDHAFEKQFSDCTLNPELFTHEAHIRLAWIHIKQYGADQAADNICGQLLNFVKKLGSTDKYNKTLTVAAIKTVNHFIGRTDAADFSEFIFLFPQLKYRFKELIATHYGMDIYHSENAKQEYLEPDLLAFT